MLVALMMEAAREVQRAGGDPILDRNDGAQADAATSNGKDFEAAVVRMLLPSVTPHYTLLVPSPRLMLFSPLLVSSRLLVDHAGQEIRRMHGAGTNHG